MELNFVKRGSRWVAEFTATGDFNLHIETASGGNVAIEQKSVEDGRYAFVRSINKGVNDTVIDTAVIVPVPPVFIKIESKSMPTMAVVTAGEGAEVGYSEAQIEETLNTPV